MTKQTKELVEIKAITSFDDLSSELILCIFDYLSPTDRYKSFFGCNTRLRQLVKQWTSYSRKELDADIKRFSTLYSWYKHWKFKDNGCEYITFPDTGQQPYQPISPCIHDAIGLHWIFIPSCNHEIFCNERVREILLRHSFRLNPFFFHDEHLGYSDSDVDGKQPYRYYYGGHIITDQRHRGDFESWIRSNYPEHADQLLDNSSSSRGDIDRACAPIFEAEWLKAVRVMRDATHQVWEELKQLEDINPLELRMTRH